MTRMGVIMQPKNSQTYRSQYRFHVALALLLVFCASPLRAETVFEAETIIDLSVPLTQTGAGGFELHGEVGGVGGEFLLDTGASMVTVNRGLFREIQKLNKLEKVRSVGARLASGKVQLLDVYRAEHFIIGAGCDLGPVEFAVVDRGGRNLLGMNALSQAAPFTISMSPPQLDLAHCVQS